MGKIMGIALIVAFIIVGYSYEAMAGDFEERFGVLLAFGAIDYKQTCERLYERQGGELNPLLGSHPSRAGLYIYGASGIAALIMINHLSAPAGSFLLDSAIATKAEFIKYNARTLNGQQSGSWIKMFPIILSFRF